MLYTVAYKERSTFIQVRTAHWPSQSAPHSQCETHFHVCEHVKPVEGDSNMRESPFSLHQITLDHH
jgi:hypothetical protein